MYTVHIYTQEVGQMSLFVGTFDECLRISEGVGKEYPTAIFKFKTGFQIEKDLSKAVWKNFNQSSMIRDFFDLVSDVQKN